jgi:hypothetical protein
MDLLTEKSKTTRCPAAQLRELQSHQTSQNLQEEGFWNIREADKVMPIRILTPEEIALEYGKEER